MKHCKKIICTLLAVVLMLTAVPLSGFVGLELPDVGLTAQAATITSYKTGDIIEFGWYPQSEVTDSATIAALNAEDGEWISYEYYRGTSNGSSGNWLLPEDYAHGNMTASDFMLYKDVIYDDDKYRGVIFDSYRPYYTGLASSSTKSHQNENGYYTNTVYWFKYEPIRWRVLDPTTGMVLSETILDSQAYQNYMYYTTNSNGTEAYWGDAEKTFYASDYANSSIRQWLNDDFCNTAFSVAQQNIIDSTNDKIYLLSHANVLNTNYGFSNSTSRDTSRVANGTAYAKCQGLYIDEDYNTSDWWLGSNAGSSSSSYYCSYSGSISEYGTLTVKTNYGVRPALNFNLSSEIFQSDVANMGASSANGTAEKYTETEIDTLVLETRNIQSWLSGSLGNESLIDKSGKLNWQMADSTAKIGEKVFEQDKKKNITINKNDLTDDIILSHDGYYNYIIPKAVADSFMGMGVTNVAEHTAYMRKEIKNGKPYVSTVFAREDGTQNPYVELQKEELVVSSGRTYAFSITADNLNEMATYYISQDEAHKIESLFGTFTTDQLKTNLQNGQDSYVYFKTASGVVSDPVKINIKFEEPEENPFIRELSEGKFNILGKDGLSITLPEDWILIGGSTIDLCDWSFPVGLQVEGNEVRVSVGFDLWTKTETTKTSYSSIDKETQQEYITKSTTTYQTTTLWENVKKGIKGSGNAFKNAKNKAKAVAIKKQLCERYGVDIADLANSNVKKTKTNVSSLGYIEGCIVNGKFIVTDMYISVAGELTISYTYQLSQGYLGLEGGGKLTVSTNWSRVTADLNLPLEFGFTANVTPSIKARGGVGWDGVASAGVYGKGTMPIVFTSKDRKLSLSITGEFGYEAQVLIWSTGEKALLSGTFGPKEFFFGKSSVERARTLQAHGLTTEDVGSAQTVYSLTERKQSSAWLGDDRLILNNGTFTPNRVGVSAAEELTFKTLQQDVFELSEAKIITAGDTTIAVWITEAAERDDYNRLTLVYSLYDVLTDTWSEPKAVYDDGFMDATPVLATDGEKIFVAWQKYCKTFTAENSANIADVLAAAEIYVAEYDILNDAFVNATRITEDNVYDYRTALTVKDGEAVVVYATANHNALMAAAGNSITKVENGNKTVLAQNISTVNNLACAVIDNAVEVAYSADADGDLQTTEDISVFYGTDTFAQFPKYYENDALSNLVYADFDGKTTLFVSDGLNIYYAANGEAVAILEEEATISSQLQAVNTTDGLSFYWLASCATETTDAVRLHTCSSVDGQWSNAICLSDEELSTELSNLAVTSVYGQVLGVYNEKFYDFIETSDGTMAIELVTNFVFFKENDCFDLAMISAELDEGDWNWGETAFIAVSAENIGNVKADSLIFTVTDSNGLQKNYLVDEQLLPGQSVLWFIPYEIPDNMADTTVTVSVSDDIHSDCNTGNDAVDFNADQASLLVASNNIEYLGRAYVLSADITNTNFAKAEKVSVEVCFDDPESEPVSSYNVGSLAKNELAVVEFAFTEKDFVFDENGTAVVYFVVNAENATHMISSFVVREAPDTYIIDSKEELLSFASEVNGGYSFDGKVIRLENDIDLSDVDWVAIGDGSNPFSGVFDGNNHSITGLNYQNDSAVYAGLFGYIKNGGVKNLTVQGSVIGANRVGMIAGYMLDSALYNCKAEGAVARTGSGLYAYVGGLVGTALHSVIINCAVETDISVAFDAEINYAAVGGIAGVASAGSSEPMCILNSYCAGDITVSGNSFSSTAMGSAQYYVGGIAGYLRDDAVNNYYYGSIIDAEEELIKDIGYAFGYVWPEFTATGDYNGVGTIIVKHNYYPEGKNAIGSIAEGDYDTTEWTEGVSEESFSMLSGEDAFVDKLNGNKTSVEELIIMHRDILSDSAWADLVERIEGDAFTVSAWRIGEANMPVNYKIACGEHEESEWIIDIEAGCTTPGSKHTYCLVCNEIMNTITIDKLEHNYVGAITIEPTCTEAGVQTFTCANDATHTYTEEVAALGHSEETLSALAPTCTTSGLTEGKKCSVCGETLVEQEVVPSLGHTEETLSALAPTCTTSGLTEGKKCSVCGETLVEQEVVPSLGHTEEVIPGKASTCTATGLTEGKKCSVCGETTLAQTVIAKKEHSKVTVNQKAATATENGYTGDVVCSVCGAEIEKGKIIPATGVQDNNCDHLCHKDGFVGFIWKIVQFFWKIFGMNPVCECGKAHY